MMHVSEGDRTRGTALLENLEHFIEEHDRILISFSGGLDSSFLAFVAGRCLPGRVFCVLLDSPLVPRKTIGIAQRRAMDWDIPLEVVPFPILPENRFSSNRKDRCYICKKMGAAILRREAEKKGIDTIADGVQKTDLREFRPGIQAMDEAGIIHPLAACGFEKTDVRIVSAMLGLPFPDQPSFSCLATRIPYGTRITGDALMAIEEAEDFLLSLGFPDIRVRLHGSCARIEVPPTDMERVLLFRHDISARFRELKIPFTSLDLTGLRSGSMDEGMEENP